MHIEKLRMQNFRGFNDVTIDFPSNLAVFIGVNGSGKSSIIDCLDNLFFVLISPLLRFTGIYGDKNGKNVRVIRDIVSKDGEVFEVGTTFVWYDSAEYQNIDGQLVWIADNEVELVVKIFGENDIFNGCSETINELTFSYSEFGQEFSRKIILLYFFGYPSNSEEPLLNREKSKLDDVEIFKDLINSQIDNNPNKSIPLFVCYSTKRSVTAYRLSASNPFNQSTAETSQVYCYIDAPNLDYQDYQLNLVRKAITSILPDYTDLKIKRSRMQIVLKKQDHELVLNQLSDGEKNLLVMVADIARRLAIANPDPTKNALEGEGIILIDEIELHLHPQWQRDIIPRLTSTFPNCQFIVTTHSPQVLSNVKKENIFIVEDFQVYPADAYTFGRDSNSILSELMGVTERPVEIQNKLTECLYKIDDGQIEEAKILLHELSDLLGHNDSEIVKANTLISFLSKVK